jgi:hypothetical protein
MPVAKKAYVSDGINWLPLVSGLPDMAGYATTEYVDDLKPTISISTNPPAAPDQGQLWFDLDTNELFMYDSVYWIEISGAPTDYSEYLTVSSASTIYATQTDLNNIDLSPYLTQSSASATYATQSNPTFTGTANFASASVVGILDVAEVRETVVTNSFSTNVMTANYNDGAIHYATVAPTANFTISLTNVPTTTSKSITMSFLITQGSTGYIPTTLNLNGSSQTIRWVGGTAPTPTSSAGKIDIFNFTLILATSNVLIASANLNI